MIGIRHVGRVAANLCVVAAVLALVAFGLPTKPASAQDEEVTTALAVAVKAASLDAALGASIELDAVLAGELPPARGIYLVEQERTVKVKDLHKKTQEFADKLAKEDDIAWAVPYVENVGGTRFYAWNEEGRGRATGQVNLEESLDITAAHEVATGRGVTVALIDTGFDMDHPLLVDRLLPGVDVLDGHRRVSDWRNGIDEDGDGLIDESHGHGTFIAGVIAQVAPDAQILPIRAMEADGVADMHVVIDAIDEAVLRGADVINLSFGTDTDSTGLKDAIERARKAGVVVVAAAGNHGSEAKRFPAAYSGVIAVGAFDGAAGRIADWGAFGDWVDVSAPGSKIVSAKPGGGLATWSGSSVSAPIVAGQVALMLEVDAKKAAKDAEKIVRDSATKPEDKRRSKDGLIGLFASLDELS